MGARQRFGASHGQTLTLPIRESLPTTRSEMIPARHITLTSGGRGSVVEVLSWKRFSVSNHLTHQLVRRGWQLSLKLSTMCWQKYLLPEFWPQRLTASPGWKAQTFNESEMALFSEPTP